MNKIELLSPVGGYEQFIAAVECGADAVYLGGASFNARSSAANFSDEELKNVIRYAHIRGVKVHLTLNILLHDSEIEDAISFAKRAYSYGVDAFIVQDLGIVDLLNKVLPDANIHISTQGSIYSAEGIKAISSLSFSRVVLARELSLSEIADVCRKTDKEIEVFVHGALCICYSGQCRFSSLIGERSGNRGKCAQPCRLPYAVYENDVKKAENYCISPKDLCGIYDLPELIKAGVTSIKIEGRLKSPEYVAAVTSIYRKYIDIAYELIKSGKENTFTIDKNDVFKLEQVFNRGGFESGYYHEKLGSKLISRERSKHWGTFLGEVMSYDKRKKLITAKLNNNISTGDGIEVVNETLPGNIVTYIEYNGRQVKEANSGDIVKLGDISGEMNCGDRIYKISDKKLNDELRKFTDGKFYKKIPINMELFAEIGNNLELVVFDGESKIQVKSEYEVQEAVNREIDEKYSRENLGKLGNTPFELHDLKLSAGEKCLVPASILNDLRRKAVELLEAKRVENNRDFSNLDFEKVPNYEKNTIPKLSVYLYNTDNLEGLELADRIYVPVYAFTEELIKKFSGKEVIPYLSSVTKGQSENYNYEKILVGNPEHLEFCKKCKEIFADYSFNIFNSYTCKALKDMGIKGLNLSFELNLEEIKNVNTDLETEITVYGRLPLMVSEHCPIGAEVSGKIGCGLCKKNNYYLEDRTGVRFPIITDSKACRVNILNGKILFVPEAIGFLTGKADYFRAYFLDEGTEERRRVLDMLKQGKKQTLFGYTAGHFYRGV